MPVLLIRHRVADYDAWKRAFMDDETVRQANGSRGVRHFRTAADPLEIWILLQWDDLFRARLYVRSDELADGFRRAGVTDLPNFWYLAEEDIAQPGADSLT